jgi:hypothetical protein
MILLLALATLSGEQIRIDLAAGPCAQRVPSLFQDVRPWLPGLALDASAAVPGEVARAKAPRRVRGLIPRRGEIRVRPWWLAILPHEVILAPDDSLSVYGARWSLFGLEGGLGLTDHLGLRAGIDLPSASWSHLSGPALTGVQDVWNLGAAAKASLRYQPVALLAFEAGWVQQVGVPLGRWEAPDRALLAWTSGTARALLHVRIPVDVKL